MEESLPAKSPAESRLLLDVGAEDGATKPSVPGALRIQTTGKRFPVIEACLCDSVFAWSWRAYVDISAQDIQLAIY